MTFTTCDIYDEEGDALGVIGSEFSSFGGRKAFSGPAVTIKCFEDNTRIKEASLEPGEGRVLVIDAGGSCRVAVLGDMIARDAMDNGWAGIIVFGCIRDRAALAQMDIGVHAIGTTPRKSCKRGEGQRDLDIQIAGVWVSPGDTVYADVDGILIKASDDVKAN